MRPRIAITLGDPAGIGPEVILKALADPAVTDRCEVTVVGSRAIIKQIYSQGYPQSLADPEQLSILDVPLEGEWGCQIKTGVGNAASGAASFAYLEKAIVRTLAGEFDGIVTGPIAKSAWKAAGYNYPGQTELLAERSGTEKFGMLFVARSPHNGWTLRTLLATTHIPLRQVPDTLTSELLTQKLDLLVDSLRCDFGVKYPHIAIAGLNPHSGERGQLGWEEQDLLIPWIEQQRHIYPDVSLEGPVPPDTLWVKPTRTWFDSDLNLEPSDGYLALYHEQGLIPVKMLAFDRAINTSIGLPFVRTSPDHGTAFDIAGKLVANETSMRTGIDLAIELIYQKIVNER